METEGRIAEYKRAHNTLDVLDFFSPEWEAKGTSGMAVLPAQSTVVAIRRGRLRAEAEAGEQKRRASIKTVRCP